jgi:hypothetical protein
MSDLSARLEEAMAAFQEVVDSLTPQEAYEEIIPAFQKTADGKDVSFRQFIRQAEIDALGLRIDKDTHSHVLFAVDSAFHENGLQYGGSDETVARVLKKLVRSAFACRAYFEARELHLVFATPKMHTAVRAAVEAHLAKLVPWLMARWALGPDDIRLRVIANEDFTNEVLRPVVRCASTVPDTSELFLRAQQLLVLCGATSQEGEVPPQRDTSGSRDEDERIGLHVRSTMAELIKAGRLTPEVVGNLTDDRYCKHVFRLNYPLLKRVDLGASLRQQRLDDKGYGRFWKDPVTIRPGRSADLLRGEDGERPGADENIAKVPVPESDPVAGVDGPLLRAWGDG